MSKIQEAISRIQAAKSAAGAAQRNQEVDDADSLLVAKLTERDDSSGHDPDGQSFSGDLILEVDREALRSAGLLAPEYHEEIVGNQYREIKRPLIAHAFGKKATQIQSGNLIMVTSALANEGKTFTNVTE